MYVHMYYVCIWSAFAGESAAGTGGANVARTCRAAPLSAREVLEVRVLCMYRINEHAYDNRRFKHPRKVTIYSHIYIYIYIYIYT